MKKRILGVILVLAMLISSMTFLNVSAATPDKNAEPGSDAYTAWLVAEGYTAISNYAEFEAMKDNIAGKYYLTADIKLENTGYLADNFTGAFDGNGHTLYNAKASMFDSFSGSFKNVVLSMYTDETKADVFDTNARIFYQLETGAYVENVVNERIFADVDNAWGAFARQALGTNIKFINVVNESTISSPYPVNNHKLGGFVGMVEAGTEISFENCINYGDVIGSQVGGFIGIFNKDVTISFKNCVNAGNIYGLVGKTSGEGSYGICGGFVGGYNNLNKGKANEGNVTVNFEDCVNIGNVTRCEKGNAATEPYKVTHGGLIGNLGLSESGKYITLNVKNCLIQNCYIGGNTEWQDAVDATTGAVTTDYTQGYAGAIVGWLGNVNAGDNVNIDGVIVNNVVIGAGDPETASLFLNVTSKVELKNVYAFGCTYNKVATGEYTIKNEGTATNVTVNKAQGSTPAEDAMNLRFLGSVDGLGYLSLGYLVAITVDGNTTYKMVSTKSVYEAVNNGTGTLTKADFGDKYIVAMTVEGEAANVTATYTVTPFALTEDGDVVVGVAKSVTLTNGVLS